MAWHRANADSRRLVEIPGIGPIGATTAAMKVSRSARVRLRAGLRGLGRADAEGPFHGRQDVGLVGSRAPAMRGLRSVLVVGATAVIQQAQARTRTFFPLAARPVQAQAAEAGGRGLGQQDGSHRLEADGDRRELPRLPAAEARWQAAAEHNSRRAVLPDRRAGACKTKRWMDRSIQGADTIRRTDWPISRYRVRNSRRGNHLGQRSRRSPKRPDI